MELVIPDGAQVHITIGNTPLLTLPNETATQPAIRKSGGRFLKGVVAGVLILGAFQAGRILPHRGDPIPPRPSLRWGAHTARSAARCGSGRSAGSCRDTPCVSGQARAAAASSAAPGSGCGRGAGYSDCGQSIRTARVSQPDAQHDSRPRRCRPMIPRQILGRRSNSSAPARRASGTYGLSPSGCRRRCEVQHPAWCSAWRRLAATSSRPPSISLSRHPSPMPAGCSPGGWRCRCACPAVPDCRITATRHLAAESRRWRAAACSSAGRSMDRSFGSRRRTPGSTSRSPAPRARGRPRQS